MSVSTPVAQITATGISAPSYADVLAWYQAQYRGIYGSDIVLDNSTQDGQWLAIQARALSDANSACIAVYNAFSPATAQGAGLSSVVKINGLAREVPTNSTATVTIVGQAYRLIENGLIQDANENIWSLPAEVIIPQGGQIDVTATCTTAGAVTADAGTITGIYTPTLGWQSVTNAAAATPGAPVETDAALRRRQAASTALPALTPLQSIVAAVEDLAGVTAVQPYENDTGAPDANGIPAYSIALVVDGGDDAAVASAILAKKIPGGPTYGTEAKAATDSFGVPRTVNFSRPQLVQLQAQVTIRPLTGYTTLIGEQIQQAIIDYLNGLDPSLASSRPYPAGISDILTGFAIGASVLRTRLYMPANLFNGPGSQTYEITALQICALGGTLGTADLTIAWNQLAQAQAPNIAVAVIS